MPISVTCQCGKSFAANDSLAGKRVKCPACAQPLAIPDGTLSQRPVPQRPADQSREPPIPVACACGRRFNAPARLAGKQVACPGCGQPLHIAPTVETDSDPFGDLSQFSAPQPTFQSSSYGQTHRAAQARASSSVSSKKHLPLIIGLVGGGVALLAVALVVGVLVLRGFGGKTRARSSDVPTEVVEKMWNTQNPNASTWERQDSKLLGFTVELPTGKALPVPRHGFDVGMIIDARSLGPEGPYFSVKRFVIPLPTGSRSADVIKDLESRALNIAVDGRMMGPKQGTVSKTTDFEIGGHPGREVTISDEVNGEPVVFHVRMLVAGKNIYGLLAGGGKSSVQEQDVRRFFDSFELTGDGLLSGDIAASTGAAPEVEDFAAARQNFQTKLTRLGSAPQDGLPVQPVPGTRLVSYRSGDLELQAIVSDASAGASKKPSVLFLHGGFAFGEGDWEMVEPFVQAGYHVMVPILRGENGQPGHFSLYYDEVDDVLAAAEAFANLPYVDAERMFIAGHSAGGTLTTLACLASDRFRAGASFSGMMQVRDLVRSDPVYAVFNATDPQELRMRSALAFATSFKCPMRLFFGSQEQFFAQQTNETAKRAKEKKLDVAAVQIPGDHFTSVDPAIRQALAFFSQHQ